MQIDNVWDAVRDNDPKNKQVSAVPLSEIAGEVVTSVPDQGGDYVFTLNGRQPSRDGAGSRRISMPTLRRRCESKALRFREWQHRDLRRTAKVLMKRAGASRDICERCLAHVIGRVEGVYDRYDYLREKREAFDRLAVLASSTRGRATMS